MDPRLDGVLQTLRLHKGELHAPGVSHASVFGSVARGDARADSDIDVLVDLDRALKPLLRESILHDAIDAF